MHPKKGSGTNGTVFFAGHILVENPLKEIFKNVVIVSVNAANFIGLRDRDRRLVFGRVDSAQLNLMPGNAVNQFDEWCQVIGTENVGKDLAVPAQEFDLRPEVPMGNPKPVALGIVDVSGKLVDEVIEGGRPRNTQAL